MEEVNEIGDFKVSRDKENESEIEENLGNVERESTRPNSTIEEETEDNLNLDCSICAPSQQQTTSSYNSDEDDEDEEEPKLKYVRLTEGNFDMYLQGDAISSVAVGEKALVVGTHGGTVHILDLLGKLLFSHTCHTTTVNMLNIDSTQHYVASCSDDGTIVITGIVDTKFKQTKRYTRPIKAVALAPDFAQNSSMYGLANGSQRMVSGGMAGQLIMNEKGWFGFQDNVLQSNDGPILNIQWKGPYIAWASDSGVKVYNVDSKQRIAFIARSENSPRPDLYSPRLFWNDSQTLYIGWADHVKIAQIKSQDPSLHPHIQSQLSAADLTNIFTTDFVVSGLVPFQNQLVLLAYPSPLLTSDLEPTESDQTPNPPEIRLIDPVDGQASSDILPVHGYERFKANDYHLALHPSNDRLYLVCPKDLILAKERDLNDRIDWFISMERYSTALDLVRTAPPDDANFQLHHTVTGVGKLFMEHLLQHEDYVTAAALCPQILEEDVEAWERWVFAFASIHRLDAIVPHVPTRHPTLSHAVYEMILNHLLATDKRQFFLTIRSWPNSLYSVPAIIAATLDALDKLAPIRDTTLLEALAELYQLHNQPDLALKYLLELQNPLAFRLIQTYHLYAKIAHQVVALLQFDVSQYPDPQSYRKAGVRQTCEGRAISLLVRHTDQIPLATVVNQLKSDYPHFLHVYLHALFLKDPTLGKEYHDLQVELYAEFDYPLLMNFLKTSNHYSLELAYQICDRRDLVPEIVFVLSRMGDHHKALHLIIARLEDVDQAIEFAKLHDDEALWDDLLKYSADKPEFLKGLLETSGSHLPPAKVVKQIPPGLPIPNLKQSIIQILQDYNLQMSLRRGCEKVLNRDCSTLSLKLKKYQHRGITPAFLTPTLDHVECLICHQQISPTSFADQHVLLFLCSHPYHITCLFPNLPTTFQQLYPTTLSPLKFPTAKDTESVDLIDAKLRFSKDYLKELNPQCPRCTDTLNKSRKQKIDSAAKFRWSYHPPDLPPPFTNRRVSSAQIRPPSNANSTGNGGRSREESSSEDLPPMLLFK